MKNLLLWIPIIGIIAPIRKNKIPFESGEVMLSYVIYHAVTAWLILMWLIG